MTVPNPICRWTRNRRAGSGAGIEDGGTEKIDTETEVTETHGDGRAAVAYQSVRSTPLSRAHRVTRYDVGRAAGERPARSVDAATASVRLRRFGPSCRTPLPPSLRYTRHRTASSSLCTSARCGAFGGEAGEELLRFARGVGALAGAGEDACEVEAGLVEVGVERQRALERRDRLTVAARVGQDDAEVGDDDRVVGFGAFGLARASVAASSNRRAAAWHWREAEVCVGGRHLRGNRRLQERDGLGAAIRLDEHVAEPKIGLRVVRVVARGPVAVRPRAPGPAARRR